ncbi:MAG: hypothetical protein WCI49_14100, partial [Ferruginibacter sp.]
VQLCQDAPCTLEASGGINLSTINAVAKTGVDFISVGSLTKSIQAIQPDGLLQRKYFVSAG